MGEWKTILSAYTMCRHLEKLFTTQSRILTTLYKKPLENIVGKGENAGNQHFLLFPQCFLPYQRNHFLCNAEFVVCKCFQFDQGQECVW